MTPFATVTSVQMAAISHKQFAVNRVMEFQKTNDHARLDDVHKLSWRERVEPATHERMRA